MKSDATKPAEDAELTRQVEMLMQGYAMADKPDGIRPQREKPKRRILDDMRRLSEHIKGVPVYQRK